MCMKKQGKQKNRCKDEARAFARVELYNPTSDREVEDAGEGLSSVVDEQWLELILFFSDVKGGSSGTKNK